MIYKFIYWGGLSLIPRFLLVTTFTFDNEVLQQHFQVFVNGCQAKSFSDGGGLFIHGSNMISCFIYLFILIHSSFFPLFYIIYISYGNLVLSSTFSLLQNCTIRVNMGKRGWQKALRKVHNSTEGKLNSQLTKGLFTTATLYSIHSRRA